MVRLEDLKKEAKKILKDGKVKYIIAYRESTNGLLPAPVFIKDEKDVERMAWNPACVHNLTRFLVDEKKRKALEKKPDERPVGLVVKGCDSRAVNVLLQENYIQREDVVLLGVSCEESGVIDLKKLSVQLNGKKAETISFEDKNSFLVTTPEGQVKLSSQDVLAERCLECTANVPLVYDVLLGEKIKRSVESPFRSLKQKEKMSAAERWAFWKEQFARCIRCYACRSVCPMCYCDECVVDTINFAVTADTTAEEKARRIKWIEKSPLSSETFVYHMVRAMHLAGRCVDCGECERACPLDIPLRFLNKKLEKVAKELFGYDVGFEPELPSLVSSFKEEDPEDFIR